MLGFVKTTTTTTSWTFPRDHHRPNIYPGAPYRTRPHSLTPHPEGALSFSHSMFHVPFENTRIDWEFDGVNVCVVYIYRVNTTCVWKYFDSDLEPELGFLGSRVWNGGGGIRGMRVYHVVPPQRRVWDNQDHPHRVGCGWKRILTRRVARCLEMCPQYIRFYMVLPIKTS